ncbi:hypothetical protein B0H13DRAFT_1889444 [Mycena leptocephala]|nr:hypothetical protein B0H13DRAFT_1889444 [Mycena leptocephala]
MARPHNHTKALLQRTSTTVCHYGLVHVPPRPTSSTLRRSFELDSASLIQAGHFEFASVVPVCASHQSHRYKLTIAPAATPTPPSESVAGLYVTLLSSTLSRSFKYTTWNSVRWHFWISILMCMSGVAFHSGLDMSLLLIPAELHLILVKFHSIFIFIPALTGCPFIFLRLSCWIAWNISGVG